MKRLAALLRWLASCLVAEPIPDPEPDEPKRHKPELLTMPPVLTAPEPCPSVVGFYPLDPRYFTQRWAEPHADDRSDGTPLSVTHGGLYL